MVFLKHSYIFYLWSERKIMGIFRYGKTWEFENFLFEERNYNKRYFENKWSSCKFMLEIIGTTWIFCHHQNYIINDGKPNWDLCKGTQLGLVSSKIVFAIWKVGGRGPSKGNYILPKGSFVWAFPHPKLPSNSPLGLAPDSINIWLFGLADWVPWT